MPLLWTCWRVHPERASRRWSVLDDDKGDGRALDLLDLVLLAEEPVVGVERGDLALYFGGPMLVGFATASHAVSAPSPVRKVAHVVLGHLLRSRRHRTLQNSELGVSDVRVAIHLGVSIARIRWQLLHARFGSDGQACPLPPDHGETEASISNTLLVRSMPTRLPVRG